VIHSISWTQDRSLSLRLFRALALSLRLGLDARDGFQYDCIVSENNDHMPM